MGSTKEGKASGELKLVPGWWMNHPEDTGHRDLLRMLARDMQPRSYLEVGVREGHSLASVLRGSDPASLVLCDTWSSVHGGTGRGSHEHIEHLLNVLGYRHMVNWFDCPSREMWRALEAGGAKWDLVHIDGDHSTDGALLDMREGWEHTRKAMVVHDVIRSPTVARAVELFGIPPTRVFTGDFGTGVWLK